MELMSNTAANGKGKHRACKVTCIVLAAVLVLGAAALGFVGNYFYDFALNPKSEYSFGTAAGIDDNEDTRWLLRTAQNVSLTSADGLKLHAYQAFQPGSHKYVVFCHGYQNNAAGGASWARHFYDGGFSVLLPDARGHGESEGDYIGMGWHERRDIIGWLGAILEADPQAEIVLYGVSMGAATVMMTSGEADLPANVKCVVEDCGYTSVWDEFACQLKELYHLPPFPILNIFDAVCRIRAGYSIIEASAVDQVAKSHTPTLFIHGAADTFVPFWMLDVIYEAAACEKEKLVVPGAAHAESVDADPQLYWSTVDAFIAKHLS